MSTGSLEYHGRPCAPPGVDLRHKVTSVGAAVTSMEKVTRFLGSHHASSVSRRGVAGLALSLLSNLAPL